MARDSRWRLSAIVLLALYGVAGVFGRFPWKADEPYAFGVIWGMLDRQQWLIPTIANEPFVEKPPFVYWLGAASTKLAWFVPPYEGSRVAIVVLLGSTAWALYAAARMLHREIGRFPSRTSDATTSLPSAPLAARTYALLALLLAAGTLGFAEHVHKLTPDLGQLAGATIALCGLVGIGIAASNDDVHASRRARAAGLLLGSGTGIAFLSKGLFVPGVVALTALWCLSVPQYRQRRARIAFAVSAVAAAPWLAIWPLWLRHVSPALFDEWLVDNNIGRFVGFVALGGNNVSLASKVVSVLVLGFPPLVLAARVVARGASRGDPRWRLTRDAPAHAAVAFYLVVSLLTLAVSASMRDVYVLPALPAMVLLGMPALVVGTADSPAARGIDIAFGIAAIALLAVWLCLVTRGDLAPLPSLQREVGRLLPLPFALHASPLALACAVAALVSWRKASRHAPVRNMTTAFCAGIAMTWIVVASVFLPWIDVARSYRSLLLEVKAELAQHDGCLATMNLGESEVALLDYVTQAKVVRVFLGHSGVGDPTRRNADADRCPWMLVLSNRSSGPLTPDRERWLAVWSGARPADRSERFVLYRTRDASR